MRLPPYPYLSDAHRDYLKRRGGPFLLVLLAHILIVIALLTLAPRLQKPPGEERMIAFQVFEGPKAAKAAAKQKVAKKKSTEAKAPAAARIPMPTPLPAPKLDLLNIDLAASDISKMPSYQPKAAPAEETADSGEGHDGDSTVAPGAGPNGEKLYNAEWYVEPTNAQLAYYMPKTNFGPGWGIIACRTAPRNKVIDCIPLGESPGSGLAQAILDAAWQFQVLPPRVGGRKLIGEWVRIRISTSVKDEK